MAALLLLVGFGLVCFAYISYSVAKDCEPKSQERLKQVIICIVSGIIAVICFYFVVQDILDVDPPSKWSQLSKEEQDQIRDNVQFGKFTKM